MKADYLQLNQDGITKTFSTRHARILFITVLSIVLICAVAWITRSFVEQQIRNSAANLLSTHKQSINNTVERLRHLPISASLNPSIVALLENGMTQTSSNAASRYLATIAHSANASLYYVIDVDGNTVASSNWQQDNSLVGKNYSFRPYFQDAMKGQNSRYFAIGIATREAGYYFASPVTNEHGIIGVVVVKNELESLQAQWQKTGHNLLLIDENNVSVLASNDNWRFKTVPYGESKDLPNLMDKLKYAGQQLAPLVDTENLQSKEIQLDNTRYLITTEHLDNQGWQLWKLTSSDSLRTATWLSIIATLLLICLSTALYLYRREKGRKNVLAAEAREAQTMRKLNRQLEQEIAERHKTQMELNNAQDELMQASKLAALGQMSAAIVHEVNQPLAAIKTYGASTKLLIDRGQMPAAIENLDKIGNLTEKLATITTDLKMFAGKPSKQSGHVCLQDALDNVLIVLDNLLDEAKVSINKNVPTQPAHVKGAAVRIEQVLTNLLTNAVDATKHLSGNRQINLHLFFDENEVVLRVSDNGHGLDTHTLQHLFDPFFTTKPIGEGVGLGLAISYGIVQEMGGTLKVRNGDEGGALFSLRLAKVNTNQN